MDKKIYTAIGMMSGTSLDGVDIALIKTDGYSFVERLDFKSHEYEPTARDAVRAVLGKSDNYVLAERLVTDAHIKAVKDFGHKADLIGFHGQTIFHDPKNRLTLQIGDGEALAEAVGMDVIYDFRKADVLAGGEGAPFMPLYHQVLARSANVALPCAVLNIGGVANLTYIGAGENDVIAFDTGPGNALIDDFMLKKANQKFDESGQAALRGTVDETILTQLMKHDYFDLPAPKSLDRDDFTGKLAAELSTENGAATLAAFTVDSIVKGFALFPEQPNALYVTGGGRKNDFLMKRLAEKLNVPIKSVDALGWNGDSLEAEGFAYLAVRSVLGLPLSLPTTTGVPKPMSGGKQACFKAA